jgi:3-deoxy-D-manno-octulosonic-acid transferase
MPFKSKAQRRKFAELLVNGKISDEAYERWNQTTGRRELPERLHPEKKPAKRIAKKAARKKSTGRKRAPTTVKAKRS